MFLPKRIPFILFQFLLLLLFILMIFNPSLTISSASTALIIWYQSLIPTLLPLLILSNLIVATRAWELLIPIVHPIFSHLFRTSPCGSFSILLGILCGYPMGAKMISDFYQNYELSEKEAKHLLTFTSFPSPMFLNGYILHQCFPNQSLTLPFLCCVYGSAFLIGYLNRPTSEHPNPHSQDNNWQLPLFTFSFLQQILLSSAQILLFVGLYMILATILASFLGQFLYPFFGQSILPLFTGILEMTSGIAMLSNISLSFSIRALIALFVCCFGGVSIALQTSTVLPAKSHWLPRYLIWKFIHALLAVCLLSIYFLF